MQFHRIVAFINLMILIFSCNGKDETKITEPPEGCIKLSALETKQDYYLPFALENDNSTLRAAILNGNPAVFPFGGYIDFGGTGFYELILIYNDRPNDTILFTTKTEEREESEWGIGTWVPKSFVPSQLGSEEIEIIYPRRYTDLMRVPFIFYLKQEGKIKGIYCSGKNDDSGAVFSIKQGAGSVNIDASAISGKTDFLIGGRRVIASLDMMSGSSIPLSGTLDTPLEIPANMLVRIDDDLTITSSGSLTVNEGVLMLIDEAVDINVNGPVTFSGTASNPVLVTCSRKDKYWGGFITRTPTGTINAEYTIFCQSGYHNSAGYDWGHAGRQALFYTEASDLILNNCFILDHTGQIFYPQDATLVLTNIFVQRALTGGQINYSRLTLRNSIFTDFPEDSEVFADEDNDALYLIGSDAIIDNTVFMYAKDDGLDSGGDEGGEVTVTNSRFEACFHEGAALSSGGTVVKKHTFINCTFTNCGQGLELGYSSPNHTVTADNCWFIANGIGIRYGDNYDWSEVDGKMTVRNSFSLQNDLDVWNMVRMIWAPKLNNMSFENTFVSKKCLQYPELKIKY